MGSAVSDYCGELTLTDRSCWWASLRLSLDATDRYTHADHDNDLSRAAARWDRALWETLVSSREIVA